MLWVIFNIIRHDGERCGGHPRLAAAMDDFNACLDHCGLVEMSYTVNSFSWCNGHQNLTHSWVQLDRVLLNFKEWIFSQKLHFNTFPVLLQVML